MKKIIQFIGLVCFILFAFFYTDKVLEVVREEDSIMIELNSIKDNLEIYPVNAIVTSNTVIPGINGRCVNINKSYKLMRSNGKFQEKDIVYDVVHPDISAIHHKDRYVIMGNSNKQMVSIIFILSNDKYLDKIEKIVGSKDIVVNYFVNYQYLVGNTTKIKEMIPIIFDDINY